MSLGTVFITILVATLFLNSDGGSAYSPLPADQFLGISPEDVVYYQSSDSIKCKDGSKNFTKAQLNDDFCDCPDGTDEPGTSACPSAKFYCQNVGHRSILLFSSRVNDGICDCCDGSDEYDGKVKCPNTCWEAGKVARDKLKRKIATYQEGVAIRKREMEHAKGALVKDEEELQLLKDEEKTLKELVERLKDHKEQLEKAEEKERLQIEKEEKQRKEAEEIANKESSKIEEELIHEKSRVEIEQESETEVTESILDEKIGLVEDSPVDQHTVDVDDEDTVPASKDEPAADPSETVDKAGDAMGTDQTVAGGDEGPENNEGLSKEELGRLVASRWTGETIEKDSEEDSGEDSNPEANEHEEIPEDTHDEDDSGYASEAYYEDRRDEYDDADNDMDDHLEVEDRDDRNLPYHSEDDESDNSDTEGSFSWLEKIQRIARRILQAVNLFRAPVDKSEAARVRKEYDELSTKLSKMQSRISSLSKKLKQDFGPEKEFHSFYGHCFESRQNKYVYKVCPFKQATQEEGYTKTRLGRWERFDASYRTMVFSDGDSCWNGPNRSLKVKLRCGLKSELTDVDEPSRCEYEALLSTPALCSEERLEELQRKLELMNQEKPNGHDEL